MIYNASNTQPHTIVIYKGERLHLVNQIDTDTNTLIMCDFPLTNNRYENELDTYERKFTRIEVLPDADFPNKFICEDEIT